MNAPVEQGAAWRELLTREYFPKLATMALALWLHASNSMLTATTMPSAVDEIGGLNLISWTFALYLAGSISAAASISLLVASMGLKQTMIRAALVFTGGCAIVALAPNMPVLLVGRVLQGLGGGGLIALVYVAQDRFFPNHLVPRTIAFLSSVWMMASFSGPVIGGAFATIGEWRMAYWAFAVQGLLLIPAVLYLLRGAEPEVNLVGERIPIVRLLLLSASILLVSISGAYYHPLGSPILILLGCLALALFVVRDQAAANARMLPAEVTDLTQAIGNGILATLLLCISIMSFVVYGPLILIELYHLTPLEAGFVVLLESLAWGSAAILFSGASPSTEPRLIRSGSAIVLLGLIALAFVFPRGLLWAVVAMVIFLNGGFGMMWGFIIKRIIAAAGTADKDRAASLLPITQQTGFALGAALSGLVANSIGLSEEPTVSELQSIAFWLFAGFLPVALIGNIMAWRFVGQKT
jgi:predicted MFS family arabinose efflux permease